jgi:phosphoribosylformylglycinamidine synthase
MSAVIQHANRGGYVLGVCNGFQVLCEAGLLPGALLHNSNQKFICSNVFLKPATTNSLLTAGLNPKTPLKIPIAHGEGRFYANEPNIKLLTDNDQVLFSYCNATGIITPETNPNGSLNSIAGICNKKRNVFGMMPHPERAANKSLGNTDGKRIFESLLSLA